MNAGITTLILGNESHGVAGVKNLYSPRWRSLGVTMPDDWYVYDDGAELGPIGQHAVVVYLQFRDPACVFVWREGLDAWMPAHDVPELAAALPPRPAEPALSENGRSVTGKIAIRDTASGEPATRAKAKERQQESAGSGYRFSWAQTGALAGLIISAADLLLALAGVKLEAWGFAGLGHDLGHISANVGVAAFIGFIAGAIRDAGNSNVPRKKARRRKPAPVDDPWSGNILAAHWRGELPLWMSFWVFGIAGNIVIAAIPSVAIAVFGADSGYKPTSIFSASTVIWAGIFAVALWQAVGVWRSATRTAEGRVPSGAETEPAAAGLRPFWAGLARIVVVVAFARLLGAFSAEGLPQLSELYKIAFQDDPDIPPYTIRITQDGVEAEIVGGFKYGLTNDFEALASTTPQLKVVRLDSVGGRLGEGEKLFAMIRERGLDTYVSSRCLSACTLAFAGGHERFLLKGAALGFHKGGFPGVSDAEFDGLQHKVFTAAGFDGKFIQKALSTPHSDLWKPSLEVLLASRVVTGVTDGTVFGASGHGANFTRETAAASLARATPVFKAIQTRFPAQFSSIIDEYFEAIQKGRTEAETVRTLRGRVRPFITSLVPQADDDVLVDYNRILIDQYSYLYARNPSACYAYAAGAIFQVNPADLSSELLQRRQAVEERIVATAAVRPETTPAAVTPLFSKLRKALIARGFTDADFSLLEATAVEKSKQAHYCRRRILFLSEISRLPTPESATLLRKILASK
jgi:uncharacterized protein DUF4339